MQSFSLPKFLCSVIFLAVITLLHAQMDETIKPKGYSTENCSTIIHHDEIILTEFNEKQALLSDLNDSKNGKLPLFSRNISCNISLKNQTFTWSAYVRDKVEGLVGTQKITSKNALGLVVLFDKLYLPEGATLHVYSPDKKQILGAYTHANTLQPIPFNAGIIVGESCIIELYEPMNVLGKSILEISEIGHAYRWVKQLEEIIGSRTGSCEVNVACPEAQPWQNEKRGVARLLVVSNTGQGFCSGSLINNVRQDCTPYLLSAQHCSEGTSTNQYSQWVFYFRYEATTCTGTTGLQNHVVNGCTKIADSNDNGGDTGSDFILLLLNSSPTANGDSAYYNGWDNSTSAPSNGFCIHHPDGDIKKISFYSGGATSTTWGGSVQNTHWNVQWTATTSGHGVTEPGSSGGALFNSSGLIVGTLTGGDSYCNTPNQPDQFGKLSYHWASNGSASNRQLKAWLDPDNTGATSLGGTNVPCGNQLHNDAGIQAVNAPKGNLCGGTFTPVVVLRNFGGNTITSVIINYDIDGNIYQYQWNGNLIAGTSTTVTLPSYTLNAGNHIFDVQTLSPNGTSDSNSSNDGLMVNFVISNGGLSNLHLRTDDYGSETSWEIKDANNVSVASGNGYNDVNNGQSFDIPLCLPAGCYTAYLYDSYGDGMSSGGNASFIISAMNGTPVYAQLTTLNFGYQTSFNFCVQGIGIEELNSLQVKIIPNPSNGIFSLNFENAFAKKIRITDLTGRRVSEKETSEKNFTINLTNESAGIYLLQIDSEEGSALKKLAVE